jgi:hypothetical protein
VDAICGLIRDRNDNNDWAKKTADKMIKEKIISEL